MNSHLCRICLRNVGSVFLDTVLSVGTQHLNHNEVIKYCLDLQVLSKSVMYNRVCDHCSKKLATFYQFKLKALINDHHLQSIRSKDEKNPIKIEKGCDNDDFTDNEIYTEILLDRDMANHKETPEKNNKLEIIPVKVENTNEFGYFSEEPEIFINDMKIEYLVSDEELVEEEETLLKKNIEIIQPTELPKQRKRKPIKHEVYETDQVVSDVPDSSPRKAKSDEEFDLSQCIEESKCTKNTKRKRRKRPKTQSQSVRKQEKRVCDLCGKSVYRLNRHRIPCARRHKEQVKPVDYEYNCELCGAHVKARKRYYRFFDLVKKNLCSVCFINNPKVLEKNFICAICGLAKVSKSALALHIASHSNEKPFKCSKCPAAFKVSGSLARHIDVVHNHVIKAKFRCDVCSKWFAEKGCLRKHMPVHTGRKDFKCHLCPKAYNRLDGLRAHLMVHSGKKNEVCPICGKGFIFKSTLAAHIKIHSEQPRVQCRYCSQTFTRSDNRKSHEKLKHPNQEVTEYRNRKLRKTRAIKVKRKEPESPKSPMSMYSDDNQ